MRKTFFVFSLVLGFVLCWSIAWCDFYVVAVGKRAKRTILVSPKTTASASGTALLNALNGITDASATNPYLIKIEPGIYNLGADTLHMKSYVDIEGSGENVTKIIGEFPSSVVVMGANFAELRFLSIENVGDPSSGTNSVGISNLFASPKITHVTVTARDGGQDSIAIKNGHGSNPIITDVTINAHDANRYAVGLWMEGTGSVTAPKVRNTVINVSGGNDGMGLFAYINCVINLNNVEIGVTGGSKGYGVYNHAAVINIQNSYIKVELASSLMWGVHNTYGGEVNIRNTYIEAMYGVLNTSSGGDIRIDRSTAKESNTSVRNDIASSDFFVGASKVDGGDRPKLFK